MLRCSIATLFRSWLASLAVGLRTLALLVRAQRHSRIACHIVFWHRKIVGKKKLEEKKNVDFENAWSPSWIFFKINFFPLKISAIGWIERKTKFQIFPIFIFRVMPKNNVAGNSGMPLSANLLKLESSILPRAKWASSETT